MTSLKKLIGLLAASLFLLMGGSAAWAQSKLTPADYVEIYNLYSAYSDALDTGNGAGRVGTFTPDGTFSWSVSKHQPESMAVLKARTDKYPQLSHPQGMYHILMNIHLTPTAAGADGTCYAMLYANRRNADGKFIGDPAFYVDKLVKTSAGWRFKSREVWIRGK